MSPSETGRNFTHFRVCDPRSVKSRGSHGEVTARNGRYRGPVSGVVDNEQYHNNDDDNYDAGDEGTDAPRYRTEYLASLFVVVASAVVDIGEYVAQQGAEHAVEAARTQQTGDHVPNCDAPRPSFGSLASVRGDLLLLSP